MKRKISLNRETLHALDGELRRAQGGVSATCPIRSLCVACPTAAYTCFNTCHP